MTFSSRLSDKPLLLQQSSPIKQGFCKFQKQFFAVFCLLFLTLASGLYTPAQTTENQFLQGFEADNSGWVDFTNPAPVRVPSGTNSINAKTGGFYGQVGTGTPNTFTRWGGYNSSFPTRGFTTSVDIYLDMSGGFANDTRADFSSAINDTAGNHRRDFIFSFGFYNDGGPYGAGNRFVVSASNNSPGNPRDPARSPYTITATGWYTFQHRFYNNAGVLAVDLTVLDGNGVVLNTWTLSNAADVIGTTVGGNRYGWFTANAFPFLAIDNSQRANFVEIFNVDDDSMASAADCDAADPAFNAIQTAINNAAVLPGDLIRVCPGTYPEDVLINKAGLRVIGTDVATTTISGPIGGSGSDSVRIGASHVTVANFTITRQGNNTTDWNNVGLNSSGIAIQGQALTNTLIRDNIITGMRTAIDINHSNGHTIRNNVIDNNHTGMILRNQTDNLTVVENFITNNRTVGVLFLDASGGTNVPLQTALNSKFNNNSISGNWYGEVVDRQTGGSLPAPGTNLKDFRYNWFGTSTPAVTTANSAEPGYAALIPVAYGGTATPPSGQPDLAGPASANIVYMPLLTSGTDTNVETVPGRGTFGFQSAVSLITVNPSTMNNWLFYNDENDTINNSLGSFVAGPGTTPAGVGSAQISVTGTQRRNLATYQFAGTSLAAIHTLSYSTYNPSAGNGGSPNNSGYLNFNVDFNGSDTWQRRLVFLPSDNGAITQDTWQEWDTINGGNALWRYSGPTWPVGVGGGGESGTLPKSWTQILSQYPGVRMRVSDSFLGIRVGEPYPNGYTENLDLFKFGSTNGTVFFDFEPGRPSVTINQATGQADPTSTSPINFTVTFSEPVTGFNNADVVLGGTAGATTAVVTGGGATYNVSVSGMTGSGTVTASVVDSAAIANSNSAPSTASTSADNTVTYFTCNNVSIPTGQTVATNSQFLVPINIDDTTGRNILGYSFILNYDPAVVAPIGLELAGTMSNGWSSATNNTPGSLNIVVFNPPLGTPLTGSGVLLNVRFVSIGGIGTTSSLGLNSFILNEGVPCVNTSNGDVTVISGAVSGAITYANALTTTPVPNAALNAAGSNPLSTATDANGLYSLSGFGAGSYTVTPSKTGQVNGISNQDATSVAQHIVGFITLSSTQQLAADVTQNGTISSLDATYIAQHVALIANPSYTGTWKFMPANRSYPNVQTNYSNQDYSAILMGEVTGNWNPGILRPAATTKQIQENVKTGGTVAVNAPANQFAAENTAFDINLASSDTTGEGIFGYEFNFFYDPNIIFPQAAPCESAGTLSAGRSVVCNPVSPGFLRVVVFSTSGTPISGAGTLLKLKFNAIGAPNTSSALNIENFIFNEGVPANVTTDGQVQILGPSAANASIGGRLIAAKGRGVANTRVTLTDTSGASRTTISNSFGFYRFSGLEIGQTYILSVASKGYTFSPQAVSLVENVTNLDLIAQQ